MGEGETAMEQFGRGKVSVWWDIENCQVPKEGRCNPHSIANNIVTSLVNMGYCGPISNISAYGDTNLIPHQVQYALNSTGISLNHVPAGVKDASDKKILVDMLFWAVDNAAPANYLLISGDRDFSNALHQLRMRKYNILLAQPQKASPSLVAAATTVWLWTSLSAGGPPLSKDNVTPSSSSDNLRFPFPEPPISKPIDFMYEKPHLTQKSPSKGRVESKSKGKQILKKVNQSMQASNLVPRKAEGPLFNIGFPMIIPDVGKLNLSEDPKVSGYDPQNVGDQKNNQRVKSPNHMSTSNPHGHRATKSSGNALVDVEFQTSPQRDPQKKKLPVKKRSKLKISQNKRSNVVSPVDLTVERPSDGTMHAGITKKPDKRPNLGKGKIYKNGKICLSPAAFKVALQHDKKAKNKRGAK